MKKLFNYFLAFATILSITFLPAKACNIEKDESIGQDEIHVSQVMTFEELVTKYAENNQITYKEAWKELSKGKSNIDSFSTKARTYRILTVELTVNSGYKPSIDYYCNTSESGNYWGITSIYSVQLNRIYKGASKIFKGTLDSWLRSPYQIEYIINGDFYNQATSTSSYSISGSFGKDSQISFSITCTNESGYYAPIYQSRIVSFQ